VGGSSSVGGVALRDASRFDFNLSDRGFLYKRYDDRRSLRREICFLPMTAARRSLSRSLRLRGVLTVLVAGCERLLVGSESSTSSSTWSFPSSSTSLSSSFSREELGDTDGHIFGWVPKPRLFEDQHLNGDGMKEGPWAWVEEDDLRRANRRYGNNWSKLIRSSRYSGRSYCAIACKWDRMKTRLRMEKLREKRRVQSKPQASLISLSVLSFGRKMFELLDGGGDRDIVDRVKVTLLAWRASLAGLVCAFYWQHRSGREGGGVDSSVTVVNDIL
ncbi:hypothetical protein FOZ62_006858, partial [Perkinsus olseni]